MINSYKNIVHLDCLRLIKNISLSKFKNSKVLILGANGFLASYIQESLNLANNLLGLNCKITSTSLNKPKGMLREMLQKNKNIKFIQTDLNKKNNLLKFKEKYDFIFHCATYASPSIFMKNQLETINLNSVVLNFFLDKCKNDNSSLLYISSVDVYGHTKNLKRAITEDLPFENFSNLKRSSYGGSKRTGEALCAFYRKNYKLNIHVVRPAITYGPGLTILVKQVIAEFIRKALYDKKILMLDSGSAIKTYGYISDITEMFLNIIQFGKEMTYNTTGLDNISIFDLASLISKKFDNVQVKLPKKRSNLIHIGSDINRVIISSKKYIKEFKKKSFITIDQGTTNLVNWNIDLINSKKIKIYK